jgi:hypothetical protein
MSVPGKTYSRRDVPILVIGWVLLVASVCVAYVVPPLGAAGGFITGAWLVFTLEAPGA